jgi:CII-binding regulator of phage lambda lysogenization HflD
MVINTVKRDKRYDNSGYLAIELEALHEQVRKILDGDQQTFKYYYGMHEVKGKISRSQLAMIELERKLKLLKTDVSRPTCKTKVFK